MEFVQKQDLKYTLVEKSRPSQKQSFFSHHSLKLQNQIWKTFFESKWKCYKILVWKCVEILDGKLQNAAELRVMIMSNPTQPKCVKLNTKSYINTREGCLLLQLLFATVTALWIVATCTCVDNWNFCCTYLHSMCKLYYTLYINPCNKYCIYIYKKQLQIKQFVINTTFWSTTFHSHFLEFN